MLRLVVTLVIVAGSVAIIAYWPTPWVTGITLVIGIILICDVND